MSDPATDVAASDPTPVTSEVTPEIASGETENPVAAIERALSRDARQRLVDIRATMQSAHIAMSSVYNDLTGMIEDQSLFDDEISEDPSEPDEDSDEDDEDIARRIRKARAKARAVKMSVEVSKN